MSTTSNDVVLATCVWCHRTEEASKGVVFHIVPGLFVSDRTPFDSYFCAECRGPLDDKERGQ